MTTIAAESARGETVAFEELLDESYDDMKKRYLKEAKAKYTKIGIIKKGPTRNMALLGTGLGAAGAVAHYADQPEAAMFLGAVGAVNLLLAYRFNRFIVNNVVGKLEKRIEGISQDDLEQRVDERNYTLPEPSDEEKRDASIELYVDKVVNAVARKEYGTIRYPFPVAGLALACFGTYDAFNGDAMRGLIASAVGILGFVGANIYRQVKLSKLTKKVRKTMDDQPEHFFVNYIQKKDPYDFYKNYVVAER